MLKYLCELVEGAKEIDRSAHNLCYNPLCTTLCASWLVSLLLFTGLSGFIRLHVECISMQPLTLSILGPLHDG